eukprot:TRINITY_DN3937_c0_g1_i2.p1 TRINITY_DN3937_c0_g1~~TRINITY_DN3937_c0_g1_i2.p1  ORF type:complete len:862 (+),score=239.32 TRINITY_DN3937_c0_g1_i2:158-2743(+)
MTSGLIHFKAMMRKNALLSIRSWKGTCSQILAPVLFMVLMCLIQRIPESVDNPTISLKLPRCIANEEKRCFTLLYTSSNNTSDYYSYSNHGDYYPGNPSILTEVDIDDIMSHVATSNDLEYLSTFDPESEDGENQVIKVPSTDVLFDFILDHPNVTQIAIIFFTVIDSGWEYYSPFNGSNPISYKILFNSTSEDTNMKTLASYAINSVQASVEAGIINVIAANSGLGDLSASFNVSLRNFPELTNNFDVFSTLGNLFLYCALMFNFTVTVYQIVNEKHLKLRQGMKMIGLSDIAYWMSWFVTNVTFLLIYIGIIYIIGYACDFAFFNRTNIGVTFLTFFVFGLSMIPMAYLLTMFLTTTRQAVNIGMAIFVAGTVLQIVFSIPFAIQWLYQEQYELRVALQFFPPFNFSKLIYDISSKSNMDAVRSLPEGDHSFLFNWSDIYTGQSLFGFTLPPAVHSFGYLMMNFGIYVFFSWYFSNVLPSEKGLVPWFMFTRNYWRGGVPKSQKAPRPPPLDGMDEDVAAEVRKAFEDVNAEVRILNLHKKYTKYFGLKTAMHALQGLSLSIRKGQVFALLGHNGAGKTTAISCLTGVFRPTKGEAYICGKSLRHELGEVQKKIGVCPQHDILFEELTAREHLEIFADIKGVPKKEQKTMIEQRLNDVLLLNVADKAAGTFSGGMKRRLSVAIATIGNPEVVFLDEPTTGLDPVSRREIWNTIAELKKNRVVVLTTHSMEEADILGDNIGVMAAGKLRCVGTSLHLKNKFGLGYRVNLSTIPERHYELRNMVTSMLPEALLIAESGGFFVFGVQTKDMSRVIPFFQFIEQNKADPNFVVKDWGMSQTTLEEVFLKVTKAAEEEQPKKKK